MSNPIVLAPMAGCCTPALVAAVSNAGGLGMYGAASLPAAQLPSIVQDIRAQLQQPDLPFGINLFVPPAELPPHTEAQQAALQQVHAYYADAAARLQLNCEVKAQTPDLAALQANFAAQVQVLLDEAVPVIAFYFGLPEQQLLSRIQAAGTFTMGTVTCLQEAQKLQAAGINAMVVQGSEAGGHRGTWYKTGDYTPHMTGTTTLVALLAQQVRDVPLLAAGGIMNGGQVAAALAAGAAAVQVGTAFLTTAEAGTPQPGRQLLLQDHTRGTTVTQAFTGRPARGLTNQATRDLQQLQQQLPLNLIGLVNARPFYNAAASVSSDYVLQLCGQGYPLCRECSAEELVQQLLQEAEAAVQELAGNEFAA